MNVSIYVDKVTQLVAADLGILVELVGGNVVDWEHQLDVVLLGLLD